MAARAANSSWWDLAHRWLEFNLLVLQVGRWVLLLTEGLLMRWRMMASDSSLRTRVLSKRGLTASE